MSFFATSMDDPRYAHNMALFSGIANKDVPGAMGLFQQEQRERKLFEMQLREAQQKIDEREALIKAAQKKKEALPGLFQQPGWTGGEAMPQMEGDVPMFSRPPNVAPMQRVPGGLNVQAALDAGYSPEEIQKLDALRNVGMDKVARTVKGMGPDGREYEHSQDDYGRTVGTPLAQWKAPMQVSQGDRTAFLDAYDRKLLDTLPIFQSSDSKASTAVTMRGQNMADARARENNAIAHAGRAPAGYRFAADGRSLEAIPGGPADKQSAATTDERKAATLLQRLDFSQKQLLAALATNPSAAKPEVLPSVLRAQGGAWADTAANTWTGTQRQQVEGAQLDILDAALTLGTGAAYTREQLEGYRKSYFPQIGDDAATVKDKQARLNNIVQAAKIAAGRAANVATTPGAAPPAQDDPLGIRPK